MLTKPRVIELLLVTTVPAMILAADGRPSLALVAVVLVGGALAAGGANTINCWIERDRDQLMRRTRHRPLPAGRVRPLGALVFCWTPPHFWALSMRYREDYAAAGIPMLPVVKGTRAAVDQILAYSIVVVAVSLTLLLVEPMGVPYAVAAIGLGTAFVWQAARLRREPTPARAIAFFSLSNTYLALLFAAVALDSLIRIV